MYYIISFHSHNDRFTIFNDEINFNFNVDRYSNFSQVLITVSELFC